MSGFSFIFIKMLNFVLMAISPQQFKEIMRLFDDIHQAGNTLVVVTHEEEIAQRAKRIIRLRDGIVAN